MAAPPRDRVTIDLRGIGNAVRMTAATRGMTVAAFARHALRDAVGSERMDPDHRLDVLNAEHRSVKLTLRLRQTDAETFVQRARTLGLSYGEYLTRLTKGTPPPLPAACREADRAVLRASTDQLAALSADLNDFMRLLRVGSPQIERYRQRIERIDTDLARHLEEASALLARMS